MCGRPHHSDRVHRLHAELTTGPVAEARHIVGSAFEDTSPGDHPTLTIEELKALFIVLRCLEPIDVQRDALLGRSTWLPAFLNPRAALDASIRFHVRVYLGYMRRATAGPQTLSITVCPEEASLLRLARSLGVTAEPAKEVSLLSVCRVVIIVTMGVDFQVRVSRSAWPAVTDVVITEVDTDRAAKRGPARPVGDGVDDQLVAQVVEQARLGQSHHAYRRCVVTQPRPTSLDSTPKPVAGTDVRLPLLC